MGTNLTQANNELDQLAKIIHEEVQKVEKELVENIYNTLTGAPPDGTPIDSGWASSNWMVSIGKPTSGVVPDRGSVSSMRKTSKNSLMNFLSSDLSTVSSIFVDNRVSYINLLNDGNHSNQSHTDFVDLAVLNARASLTRKRIR